MASGQLRVLLGAAPGVGKTYALLEEGRRLHDEGRDVVIGLVETHDRTGTLRMTDGLETMARHPISHRGIALEEMDLDAVLRRDPDVALVDELAHTNAPGSRHHKRWQDVQDLLRAGINVITTVNIQHIDSLNDVVEKVTGVPQRETIPDRVLRDADQIELVDLPPQRLRDRLAEGKVYPAGQVDAAMSNYFRLGNLTALRELALLWLADNVDDAMQQYRREHHIDSTWETRERVVVALTGGPEGETLIRRGARIVARSGGGELLAVHVTSQDGLRPEYPGLLTAQRALAEELGGSYHQLVGDDVPEALLSFATSANATQIVIGTSRRGWLKAALSGPGIGIKVIRKADSIDVHIVNHAGAGNLLRLPVPHGALSWRRRLAACLLALAAGPPLTWFFAQWQQSGSLAIYALGFQLLVVLVALVGGVWPALGAALAAGIAMDYFFAKPYHAITISEPRELLVLVLFVLTGMLVSLVVDRSARISRVSRRAMAESEMLATVAGDVLRDEDPLQALISHTREAFGLTGVRLRRNETILTADGTGFSGSDPIVHKIDDSTELDLFGPELDISEQRLLAVIATQIEILLEHRELADKASEVEPLEAANKVRAALLSAVSHDIRRPLATATAAVTGLISMQPQLSTSDREELLTLAQSSLENLTGLVTDLLDISRLQTGVYPVALSTIDPTDVIAPALDELSLGPDDVEFQLGPQLPEARADPVLLKRVLVNLLANAVRYNPSGKPVTLAVTADATAAHISVIDRGPGVPPERRDHDIFMPFQRRGDTDNTTGLGLGLALSKGFTEGMGGTLHAEQTPGGGLTMVISLPLATDTAPAGADLPSTAAPDATDEPTGGTTPDVTDSTPTPHHPLRRAS